MVESPQKNTAPAQAARASTGNRRDPLPGSVAGSPGAGGFSPCPWEGARVQAASHTGRFPCRQSNHCLGTMHGDSPLHGDNVGGHKGSARVPCSHTSAWEGRDPFVSTGQDCGGAGLTGYPKASPVPCQHEVQKLGLQRCTRRGTAAQNPSGGWRRCQPLCVLPPAARVG